VTQSLEGIRDALCSWIRFVTERDNAVSPSENAGLNKRVTEDLSLADREEIGHGAAHLIESAMSDVDERCWEEFVDAVI